MDRSSGRKGCRCAAIWIVAVFLGCGAGPPSQPAAASRDVTLLYTNDFESAYDPNPAFTRLSFSALVTCRSFNASSQLGVDRPVSRRQFEVCYPPIVSVHCHRLRPLLPMASPPTFSGSRLLGWA